MGLFSSSRPGVTLRVLARLPALLSASGGLKVSKANGIWTFEPDWSVLSLINASSLMSSKEVWVRDASTGTYARTTLASIVEAMAQGGGAVAIAYTFDTTTTDADPGAGKLRLDNVSQKDATTAFLDLADTSGSDWTSVIDTFDDSTNPLKGYLRITKMGDATAWLLFSVSAVTSATGYRKVTLANVGYSAAAPFAEGDTLIVAFDRVGDKGVDATELFSLDSTAGASPKAVTIRDISASSAWATAAPHIRLDFDSQDGSGVGAGIRAAIGLRSENAIGGASALDFLVAPVAAGTLVRAGGFSSAGIFDATVKPTGGSVSNALADLFAREFNVRDYGTTEAAFTSAKTAGKNVVVPAWAYTLASDVTWAAGNAQIKVDPNATFSGAGRIRFDALLPYHSDLFSFDIQHKVLDGSFPAYSDIFQFARYVKMNSARKGVALYGEAEAAFAGSNAWGLNCAGIAAAGAGAIGAEITALALAVGASTVSLLLGGKGFANNTTALQISSGDNVNSFLNGIVINNTAGTKSSIASTGTVFSCDDAVCAKGFSFTGSVFSTSFQDSPNLFIGSNTADFDSRLQVYGSNNDIAGIVARGYAGSAGASTAIKLRLSSLVENIEFYTGGKEIDLALRITRTASAVNYFNFVPNVTGAQPTIAAEGSDANVYLALKGQGTSGVLVQDGAGATKIRVSTTGIGFNGSSAIAKPTITGSKGANAALTSLLTQLASYGLITDSTT